MNFFIPLSILIIFICLLLFFVVNLLRKNERYEDMIDEQNNILKEQNEVLSKVLGELKGSREFINQVDERGIFQSDDEVGTFFGYMVNIQNSLEEYFTDNLNAKEEK